MPSAMSINRVRSKVTNLKEDVDRLQLEIEESIEQREQDEDTDAEELTQLQAAHEEVLEMVTHCDGAITTLGGDI